MFNIELQASDRLGNTATLLRCMDYRPLGVPLERQAFGPTTNPLHAPLSGFQLTSNSALSSLLSGTHPCAGLMTVTLRNPTSETAYVTFSPSTINPRYSESWSYLRVPTGAPTTVSIDCATNLSSPPAADQDFCNRTLTGIPSPLGEAATDVPFTPQLSVRAFAGTSELTGTPVGSSMRFTLPGPATYDVVVGIKTLPEARFQTSTGYSERVSSYWRNGATHASDGTTLLGNLANTSLDATVALSPTGRGRDIGCMKIDSVLINEATGETAFTCVRQQRFAAQRYLASAGVSVGRVDLAAVGTATSSTTVSQTATFPTSLLNLNWTTTETTP